MSQKMSKTWHFREPCQSNVNIRIGSSISEGKTHTAHVHTFCSNMTANVVFMKDQIESLVQSKSSRVSFNPCGSKRKLFNKILVTESSPNMSSAPNVPNTSSSIVHKE